MSPFAYVVDDELTSVAHMDVPVTVAHADYGPTTVERHSLDEQSGYDRNRELLCNFEALQRLAGEAWLRPVLINSCTSESAAG